jgi:hypothetical protein
VDECCHDPSTASRKRRGSPVGMTGIGKGGHDESCHYRGKAGVGVGSSVVVPSIGEQTREERFLTAQADPFRPDRNLRSQERRARSGLCVPDGYAVGRVGNSRLSV